MNISLVALLLFVVCSSGCDTECYCHKPDETAHCQGDPALITLADTDCGFKPRTIYYEPCGSIKPPYSTTVSFVTSSETETTSTTDETTSTVLQSTSTTETISYTTSATHQTKRLTKTKRTTTTLLTTTPIDTSTIPHSTTTLPTLSYDRPTKPVKLTKPPKPAKTLPPTLPPTLPIPEPATNPMPQDSEPHPFPQDSEPLQPPNMERHQATNFSISNSWAEVWGPIAGGLGLAGGGVMLVRRRRRQQRRANLSRLMLRLHDGNNDNADGNADGTNGGGNGPANNNPANGGANGPANGRANRTRATASTASPNHPATPNHPASPNHPATPNQPATPNHPATPNQPATPNRLTASATDQHNLSLNRDHTAAALALNCMSPELQRHSLAYREWLFDNGYNPDLIIQGSQQSKALIRQFRIEYVELARRVREGEEERRRANEQHQGVLLDPNHRVALVDMNHTNSTESIVNETEPNNNSDRALTDASFAGETTDGSNSDTPNDFSTPHGSVELLAVYGARKADLEVPDGEVEGAKKKKNGKKRDRNGLDEAAILQICWLQENNEGGNRRPRRSEAATKRPERLGCGNVVEKNGSKYDVEIE